MSPVFPSSEAASAPRQGGRDLQPAGTGLGAAAAGRAGCVWLAGIFFQPHTFSSFFFISLGFQLLSPLSAGSGQARPLWSGRQQGRDPPSLVRGRGRGVRVYRPEWV